MAAEIVFYTNRRHDQYEGERRQRAWPQLSTASQGSDADKAGANS